MTLSSRSASWLWWPSKSMILMADGRIVATRQTLQPYEAHASNYTGSATRHHYGDRRRRKDPGTRGTAHAGSDAAAGNASLTAHRGAGQRHRPTQRPGRAIADSPQRR